MADNISSEVELVLKATDAYTSELKKAKIDFTDLPKSAKAEWKKLQRQLGKFEKEFDKTAKEAKKDWGKLLDELDKTPAKLKKIEKSSKGIKQRFGGMKTLAAGVAGSFVIKSFIDAGTALENVETRMNHYYQQLGDVTQAERTLAEVRDISAKTPFQFTDVAEARFTLAKMTDGALDSADALLMVGDAAANTADKDLAGLAMWVSRAYSALQNNQAAGEATLRLTELGVISGEARTKIEKLQNQARGKEAWGVLQAELLKSKGLMGDMADTMEGKWSTVKDQIAELQRQFLSGGAWEDGKGALASISETLQEMIDDGTAAELGKQFGEFLDTVKELLPYADEFMVAWGSAKLVGGIADLSSSVKILTGNLGNLKGAALALKGLGLAKVIAIAGAGLAAVGSVAGMAKIYLGGENYENDQEWEQFYNANPEILAMEVRQNKDLFAEYYKSGKDADKVRELLGFQGTTGSSFLKDQQDYIQEIIKEKGIQEYDEQFNKKAEDVAKDPVSSGLSEKEIKRLAKLREDFSDHAKKWEISRIEDTYDRELAELNLWAEQQTEKYKEVKGAQAEIDAEYNARFMALIEGQIDEEAELRKKFEDQQNEWLLASIDDEWTKQQLKLVQWKEEQIEAYQEVAGAKEKIDEEYRRRSAEIDRSFDEADKQLQDQFSSEKAMWGASPEEREALQLEQWKDTQLETYKDVAGAKEEIEREFLRRKEEMELKHEENRQQLMMRGLSSTLGLYAQFFGNIKDQNKAFGAFYKVFATTKATIDGILAVQRIYHDVPFPLNIPASIAMGGIVAQNVAKVSGMHFAGGRGPVGSGVSDTRYAKIADSEVVLNQAQTANLVWAAANGSFGGGQQGNRQLVISVDGRGYDEASLAREIVRQETYRDIVDPSYALG